MDSSHYFKIRSLQGFNKTEELEYRRFVKCHFKCFGGDTQEEFDHWLTETEHFVHCLPPSYRSSDNQLYLLDQLLQYGAREIFLAYEDVCIRDLRSLDTLIKAFFSVSPSLTHISKYVWDYSWLELYHDFDAIVQHHRFTAPSHTSLKSTSLFRTTEHEVQFRQLIMSNCTLFDGDPAELRQWLTNTGTHFAQQALTESHQLLAIRFLLTGHALDLYTAHADLVHNFNHLTTLLLHAATPIASYTSLQCIECSHVSILPETSVDWPTREQATSTWDDASLCPSSIVPTSLEPATIAASRQSLPSSPNFTTPEPSTSPIPEHSTSESFISLPPVPPILSLSVTSTAIASAIAAAFLQSPLSSQKSAFTADSTCCEPARTKRRHHKKRRQNSSSIQSLSRRKSVFSARLLSLSSSPTMISSSFRPQRPSFFSAPQPLFQPKHSILRRKRSQTSPTRHYHKNCYGSGRKFRHTPLFNLPQCSRSLICTSPLLQSSHISVFSSGRKPLYVRFKMKIKLAQARSIAPPHASHRFHYVRPPDHL